MVIEKTLGESKENRFTYSLILFYNPLPCTKLFLKIFSTMKHFSITLFFAFLFLQLTAQVTTKLYRYNNAAKKDHLYTTSWDEIKEGKYGYVYEGVAGYVMAKQDSGTIPCYRYLNNNSKCHFYTTSFTELGNGNNEYTYEGIAFYAYAAQVANTAPFHRYNNDGSKSHFYTTSWDEMGKGKYGYVYEGIACYIFTTDQSNISQK